MVRVQYTEKQKGMTFKATKLAMLQHKKQKDPSDSFSAYCESAQQPYKTGSSSQYKLSL